MSLATNFRTMALYNKRINEQLLDKCLTMPSEQLQQATHSFFPTIISYWNHLLFGDLILLGRIASNNIAQLSPRDFADLPTPKSPHDIYCSQLSDIIKLRVKLDTILTNFCDRLTDQDCDKLISYTTTEGELISKPVAIVIQHIFNHQTHHRGQLTCIMSQFGVDYGCMDLPVIVGG